MGASRWWGEYVGPGFQKWFKKRDFSHKIKKAYSLESNSGAERLNPTLLDMVRMMLLESGTAQKDLWAEVIATACFISNRLVN